MVPFHRPAAPPPTKKNIPKAFEELGDADALKARERDEAQDVGMHQLLVGC